MLGNLSIDLYELNFITIAVRVALAIFVGGLIGTERDIKNRAAGVRTHMLVCLGAAVVMLTNQYAVITFPDLDIDLTRMGAQVISGIGFLGAGTILVTSHNRIRGLTTAAGLWAAATLGLAIGIGFYEMAFVGSLAVLFIVVFLRPYKKFVRRNSELRDFTLLIYTSDGLDDFFEFTSDEEIKILNMDVKHEDKSGEDLITIIEVTIELAPETLKEDFLDNLRNLETITHVTEI